MSSIDNKTENIREFLDSEIVLKSYPQYLLLELTRACNLSCVMCEHDESLYNGQHMSDEILDKIFSSVFFDKATVIEIRGYGESLILPNIINIIERIGQAGKVIKVVSNLSFLRLDVLDVLAKYNAIVHISIDSPDPIILQKLRKKCNPKLIFSNVLYLSEKYIELHDNNGNLSIQCTIQKPALDTLYQFASLLETLKVKNIRIYPVSSDSEELNVDKHVFELDQSLQKLQLECEKNKIALIPVKKIGSMPLNPYLKNNCINPWTFLTVNCNGLVGFCDCLTYGQSSDKFTLGDIREQTLDEIWNSEKWRKLRSNFLIHEACIGCWPVKYTDSEINFLK